VKVVIFAGGLGSRISEESHLRPKPMIEIGGKPILWHILKIYAAQGFNEFVICLGYKGYIIKEYFINYFIHNSDMTVDVSTGQLDIHQTNSDHFKVTLIDTGVNTLTAGRLRRVKDYVGNETFMLTYGDGVADVDMHQLLAFHRAHGKIGTVTAVQPKGKFGSLLIDPQAPPTGGTVLNFEEKPKGDGAWINGGFFVLEPQVFDYLHPDADNVMWEQQPLHDLTAAGQLAAYQHRGFWKAMDTLRDRVELEQHWEQNPAWKLWK